MSITLYRKYRPQSFSEVVGQNHVKLTLQNEIVSGKISHAYLFSGPHGVGKTTLARILTKALNCRQRQGYEPCNQCSSCLEINQGRSMDMIEIDAASNRGINEIRELREQVKFIPMKENYKVFIIDEVHMLTTEAFNALLKTLEEPPGHAIFVLATTEIQKVPETIISRCQHFDFKKVPVTEVFSHLSEIVCKEKIKVDKKVLENIARHSGGFLRDAVSLLGQILTLGDKEITEEEAMLVLPRSNLAELFEFLNHLFKSQTVLALGVLNKFVDQGGDVEHFTREAIEYLRKIMLAKATDNWQELLWDLNQESLKELNQLVGQLTVADLRIMLELFLEALTQVRSAEIVQLPLEIAVVKIGELNGQNNDRKNQPPSSGNSGIGIETKLESPKTVVKPEKTLKTVKISLEEIKNRWHDLIQELKNYNHSLSGFIKVGQPLRIEGDQLVIGFKYSFHWERIKEPKNKHCVEEVLKSLFNQELFIKGEIDEKLENFMDRSVQGTGQDSVDVVETVLETLGGEVINS